MNCLFVLDINTINMVEEIVRHDAKVQKSTSVFNINYNPLAFVLQIHTLESCLSKTYKRECYSSTFFLFCT